MNKNYANVIKFMKITSNLAQNKQKRQKEQNDKKLIFQKNSWKMQTCINPY